MISPTLHFDIPLGTPRERHVPSPRHGGPSTAKRDGSSPKSIGKGDNSGAFPVHLRTNKIVPSSLIPSLINQLEHCDTSITPVCLEALYKFSVSASFERRPAIPRSNPVGFHLSL